MNDKERVEFLIHSIKRSEEELQGYRNKMIGQKVYGFTVIVKNKSRDKPNLVARKKIDKKSYEAPIPSDVYFIEDTKEHVLEYCKKKGITERVLEEFEKKV